jgi:hypothetical protein
VHTLRLLTENILAGRAANENMQYAQKLILVPIRLVEKFSIEQIYLGKFAAKNS